jgi:hypothetical protein
VLCAQIKGISKEVLVPHFVQYSNMFIALRAWSNKGLHKQNSNLNYWMRKGALPSDHLIKEISQNVSDTPVTMDDLLKARDHV